MAQPLDPEVLALLTEAVSIGLANVSLNPELLKFQVNRAAEAWKMGYRPGTPTRLVKVYHDFEDREDYRIEYFFYEVGSKRLMANISYNRRIEDGKEWKTTKTEPYDNITLWP